MDNRLLLQKHLSPFFLGAALCLGLAGSGCRSMPEAEAGVPTIPVDLTRLQSETIKESTVFVGNLEAVQTAEVRSEIQGRVEQVLVTPGQEVAAGQALMRLKPDQTVPQLQGAVAGVDIARGNRDNALKALDIARAQRDTLRSTLELDTANVDRAERLAAAGALAEIRLDEARAKLEETRNRLRAADEQVAAAEVAIQQAEAQIRQAQAQADASLVSVEFKNVVAPIAGVVDDVQAKVGDYVSTGQPITTVTQAETLLLNMEVPPEQGPRLRTGLAVELLNPTSKDQLATGSLTFVSPNVTRETQSILTKAQFRNVDGLLRDGQTVEARIIWNTRPGILIPVTAISRVGGKEFVYVLDEETAEDGKPVVRLTPVELGDIQGDDFQVLSGLEQGDRIAVSNILKLKDGTPVEPNTASQP
jgi:RND family efflux transporter MFP subunit